MSAKETYTPKEAAAIWRVSDQTVYRMIAAGEVTAEGTRVGFKRTRYEIPASEIQRICALLDHQGNSVAHFVRA